MHPRKTISQSPWFAAHNQQGAIGMLIAVCPSFDSRSNFYRGEVGDTQGWLSGLLYLSLINEFTHFIVCLY